MENIGLARKVKNMYHKVECPHCSSLLSAQHSDESALALVKCPVCTKISPIDQRDQVLYPLLPPPPGGDSLQAQCVSWTVVQMCVFLKNLGMDHLLDSFAHNQIDGNKFLNLSYSDLRQPLGIHSEADCQQILAAIKILRGEPSAPQTAPPGNQAVDTGNRETGAGKTEGVHAREGTQVKAGESGGTSEGEATESKEAEKAEGTEDTAPAAKQESEPVPMELDDTNLQKSDSSLVKTDEVKSQPGAPLQQPNG